MNVRTVGERIMELIKEAETFASAVERELGKTVGKGDKILN
jgi:hypothetical protein